MGKTFEEAKYKLKMNTMVSNEYYKHCYVTQSMVLDRDQVLDLACGE